MAKEIIMIVKQHCPQCDEAFALMRDVTQDHPEYNAIDVDIVDSDERPEIANQLDYYYLPTYYVDGVKVQEGKPTRDDVERVYKEAMS